jgi:hypothetical protein
VLSGGPQVGGASTAWLTCSDPASSWLLLVPPVVPPAANLPQSLQPVGSTASTRQAVRRPQYAFAIRRSATDGDVHARQGRGQLEMTAFSALVCLRCALRSAQSELRSQGPGTSSRLRKQRLGSGGGGRWGSVCGEAGLRFVTSTRGQRAPLRASVVNSPMYPNPFTSEMEVTCTWRGTFTV